MLLQLLVTLIEQFEETHYSILQGTPNSMLMHLMDARDITTEALAEVIGSLEVALQIVNGRTISKTQAEALADYFHVVDVSLFMIKL